MFQTCSKLKLTLLFNIYSDFAGFAYFAMKNSEDVDRDRPSRASGRFRSEAKDGPHGRGFPICGYQRGKPGGWINVGSQNFLSFISLCFAFTKWNHQIRGSFRICADPKVLFRTHGQFIGQTTGSGGIGGIDSGNDQSQVQSLQNTIVSYNLLLIWWCLLELDTWDAWEQHKQWHWFSSQYSCKLFFWLCDGQFFRSCGDWSNGVRCLCDGGALQLMHWVNMILLSDCLWGRGCVVEINLYTSLEFRCLSSREIKQYLRLDVQGIWAFFNGQTLCVSAEWKDMERYQKITRSRNLSWIAVHRNGAKFWFTIHIVTYRGSWRVPSDWV